MDVTKLLEADHRQVEDLFARIEKAEGEARTPLLDELLTALKGHMQLEEQVLYPRISAVTGEESVQEADTEHDLARQGIVAVQELAPDEPGFGAALDSLKAGILHHVEEEEGEMFPELRAKGQRVLDEIATPFMKLRRDLGLPVDAAAIADVSTKDELLVEAKQAGIQGASSMTKVELAESLTQAMT